MVGLKLLGSTTLAIPLHHDLVCEYNSVPVGEEGSVCEGACLP